MYLIQQFGKLMFMVAFLIYSAETALMGAITMLPLLGFPLVLILFIWCRTPKMVRCRKALLAAETAVQTEVDRAVH